jgi:hypothetical protein
MNLTLFISYKARKILPLCFSNRRKMINSPILLYLLPTKYSSIDLQKKAYMLPRMPLPNRKESISYCLGYRTTKPFSFNMSDIPDCHSYKRELPN